MSNRRSRMPGRVGYHSMRSDRLGQWRRVMDLDFKTMTAGALTENGSSLSVVDGVSYYVRARNAANTSYTMTDGTGLVCDFASSTNGENRINFKFGDRLTLSPDGHYPRVRVAAAFTGLVAPQAGDYIGCGINAMWRDHNDGFSPRVMCKYRFYGGDYNWYAQANKGAWGGNGGSDEASPIVDGADEDNGVLSCLEAGAGVWHARGHVDDAIIAAPGQEPFKAWVTGCGVVDSDNDAAGNWYRSDAGANSFDGPYAYLAMKNGSNASQAVTWTRLVVEEFS